MDKTKRKVTIVGTGNVACHLFKVLSSVKSREEWETVIVNSRTLEGLPELSDLILISVKDDAIPEVALRLIGKGKTVAHTSGSVSIDVLKGIAKEYGVFYPLQTFSKKRELNYKEIPFFIEGNDEQAFKTLRELASEISAEVFEADSQIRKKLHIAAVFACNFSNHLVSIADDLLHEEELDYKVLLPLLKETIGKLDSLPPREAQTGPAVRDDESVMTIHKEMLRERPELQTIYQLLSDSIRNLK